MLMNDIIRPTGFKLGENELHHTILTFESIIWAPAQLGHLLTQASPFHKRGLAGRYIPKKCIGSSQIREYVYNSNNLYCDNPNMALEIQHSNDREI